jgi:hypothetical protein
MCMTDHHNREHRTATLRPSEIFVAVALRAAYGEKECAWRNGSAVLRDGVDRLR